MARKDKKRCSWVTDSPLYISYHDHEWGVPIYDDQHLFEFLILEGAQAGLSWITILNKRESYRQAFNHFDATKMAYYDKNKITKLLQNTGIIRNRLKINAAITNAKAFLHLKEKHISFANFIWDFVEGEPICNKWKSSKQVPTQTPISIQMSKELKKHGFRFVGPTICYAFMQAVGLVNDHLTHCFRYHEIVRDEFLKK